MVVLQSRQRNDAMTAPHSTPMDARRVRSVIPQNRDDAKQSQRGCENVQGCHVSFQRERENPARRPGVSSDDEFGMLAHAKDIGVGHECGATTARHAGANQRRERARKHASVNSYGVEAFKFVDFTLFRLGHVYSFNHELRHCSVVNVNNVRSPRTEYQSKV